MGKKTPVYVADFESVNQHDDCRVWCWGVMELGNRENYVTGLDIESFFDWVLKTQKANVYFHNLKFDSQFIVDFLLRNGYEPYFDNGDKKPRQPKTFYLVRTETGLVYYLDVLLSIGKRGVKNKVSFIDSYKKIPMSVRDIAKTYGMEIKKGEIEYNAIRPVGYEPTIDEWDYLKKDIEIDCIALEEAFDSGLTKSTASSDAFNSFKSTLPSIKHFEKMFPVLNQEYKWEKDREVKTVDDYLRKAYKGGYTFVNPKYKGKEIGCGKTYDVNSLYPSVMYGKDLPYGKPIEEEGEYKGCEDYPLAIMEVDFEFHLKDDFIPTIQIKKDTLIFRETEYLMTSNGKNVRLLITNIDWEIIKEHYHVDNVKHIRHFKFKAKKGIFKDFIEKHMEVKKNSEGGKRYLAKLMLNSVYGKFGSSTNRTNVIPFIDERDVVRYEVPMNDKGEIIKTLVEPIYTPMAIFITSYAREVMIRTAQKCGERFIYCDTDSLHITGEDEPVNIKDKIDPNELGFWKHEYDFVSAKYLRSKTYYNEVFGYWVDDVYEDDGKSFKKTSKEKGKDIHLNVVCAGMPEKVKKNVTKENFKIGSTFEGKNVTKNVRGGTIIESTYFTIKE